jgi:hypothetical protein
MDISGYGYGVWLYCKDFPRELKHIPHVTLACNLSTEHDAKLLLKGLKSYIHQHPLKLRVFPKAQLLEGAYSKNDMYTQCWGYYCDLIDLPQSKIEYWIKAVMKKTCLSGSTSNQMHITIDYENNNNLEDLPHIIELETTMVVANVLGKYDKWHILS